MYGSSLRMETRRPRALRIRPMLAAVMPLPREEVTPPVTKTYFAMGKVLRGFFQCYRIDHFGASRPMATQVALPSALSWVDDRATAHHARGTSRSGRPAAST